MPSLTLFLTALAVLLMLGVVLIIDFFFRRDVYNRSDPVSFALLLYSFLLVSSDTGLNIVRQITGKDVNLSLVIAGAIYLGVVFAVFQFAKFAHKNFKAAQDDTVREYLESIRSSATAPDAVWRALEALGTSAIEPDVFLQQKTKRKRRIEYLKLVRQLTGAAIEPELDQEKLLVQERSTRLVAQIGYSVASSFGLLSTLYFFFVRLR